MVEHIFVRSVQTGGDGVGIAALLEGSHDVLTLTGFGEYTATLVSLSTTEAESKRHSQCKNMSSGNLEQTRRML
jgi:hypothetical protein